MRDFINTMIEKVRTDFSNFDLGLLKTYGAIPGLIIGAFFPYFIKQYMWILLLIWIPILIRYIYVLFFKQNTTVKFGAKNHIKA